MTLSTYDDLQTSIADYIMRSDAPIASFIALAQNDVAVQIKHYRQETTATLSSDTDRVELPADFQDARRILVNGQIARPISAYDTEKRCGEIGYYRSGNSYVFRGYDDSKPLEVELLYSARIPAISESVQSNWLTTYFPAVLFHAALIRAYRWMKDKDAEAMEKASLQEAIAVLAADNARSVNSGNQLQIDFGGPLF